MLKNFKTKTDFLTHKEQPVNNPQIQKQMANLWRDFVERKYKLQYKKIIHKFEWKIKIVSQTDLELPGRVTSAFTPGAYFWNFWVKINVGCEVPGVEFY